MYVYICDFKKQFLRSGYRGGSPGRVIFVIWLLWLELGTRCPKLALLTAPNIREYFYTEIRFSTPGSAPSCKSADTWCRPRGQPRTHARKQQQHLLQQHACRSMHAGSCMPVHACRFMHAGCVMPERYATRITYFPRRGQIPRRGRTSKIPKMVLTLFSQLEVLTGYC